MRASPFMVAGWGYGVSSGCHYFCKIVGNLLRKSTGLSHPRFLTREDGHRG